MVSVMQTMWHQHSAWIDRHVKHWMFLMYIQYVYSVCVCVCVCVCVERCVPEDVCNCEHECVFVCARS